MNYYKPISTLVECGVKLSKHDEVEDIDPTFFKRLVGSLHYLTCTRPNILYDVGLVSRYMENPKTTHLKLQKESFTTSKVQLISACYTNFLMITSLLDIAIAIGWRCKWSKEHHRICVLHGRYYFQMDVKEATNCHAIHLWSWVCSCHIKCLSCNLAQKFAEGVGFATRRAKRDLCW